MTAPDRPRPPEVRGGVVARNALLNLVGTAAPLVVAVLTLPYLIRGLGTERFGILAIAWMLLTYLAALGLGSTTTRYAAEALGAGRSGEIGGIAWTTSLLQVGVGIIEGAALAALTPWLVGAVFEIPEVLMAEARLCLYLLAASIPLLGLAIAFRGLIEAAQRFDLALAVQVPVTVATYVAGAAAAVEGWSLPAVFGVILAGRLVSVPAYGLLVRRALPGISFRPALHTSRLGELAGFAGWVGVSTIVSPLVTYLDRFVVGAVLSMTAVAFYSPPYEVVSRLAMVPGGIVAALYPAFSQLSGHGDRHRAESLAGRSINMVAVLLGPLVVLVVGGAADGLAVWLGPEYAEQSALALQILAVGVLVNGLAYVPFGLLQSMGRPDLPARFHLLELPIQLGLAWALVSVWGIAGAALAWTLRVTLDAGLLFAASARLGLLSPRSLVAARLPRTLTVIVIAGTVAVVAAAHVAPWPPRVAVILAASAGTGLVLWRVAISPDQRTRLLALLTLRRTPG